MSRLFILLTCYLLCILPCIFCSTRTKYKRQKFGGTKGCLKRTISATSIEGFRVIEGEFTVVSELFSSHTDLSVDFERQLPQLPKSTRNAITKSMTGILQKIVSEKSITRASMEHPRSYEFSGSCDTENGHVSYHGATLMSSSISTPHLGRRHSAPEGDSLTADPTIGFKPLICKPLKKTEPGYPSPATLFVGGAAILLYIVAAGNYLLRRISIKPTNDDSLLVPSYENILYLYLPLSDSDGSKDIITGLNVLYSSRTTEQPKVPASDFYVLNLYASDKSYLEGLILKDYYDSIGFEMQPIKADHLSTRVTVIKNLYTTGRFHHTAVRSYCPDFSELSSPLIHVVVHLTNPTCWKKHIKYMLNLIDYFECRLDITFSNFLDGYSVYVTAEELEKIKKLPNVVSASRTIMLSLTGDLALEADNSSKNSTPLCNVASKGELSPWHLVSTGIIDADSNTKRKLIARKDKEAIIFLVDSGLQKSHTELSSIEKSNYAVSAFDKESPYEDILGHGTQLAGIMKGKSVGIAPDIKNIKVVPLRIFSDSGCESFRKSPSISSPEYDACLKNPKITTHEKVYDALRWVLKLLNENKDGIKEKVCIINYAVNGTSDAGGFKGVVEELLKHENVYFVASAGNDGLDAGLFYPASLKTTMNTDRMFVVAAGSKPTNPENEIDKLYPSSGYGNVVEFVAPGEKIYTSFSNVKDSKSCLAHMSGTSPATSFVSLLIALTGLEPQNTRVPYDLSLRTRMQSNLVKKIFVPKLFNEFDAFVVNFRRFVEDQDDY